MGSLNQVGIPVIDFANEDLKPGSSLWSSTCKDVRLALEQHGCFIVEYDEKISPQIHNEVFDALEELFDLPLEKKIQNVHVKPLHGYVGQYPEVPLHEALGIEDATTLEGVQHFTHLMWPQGNDNFCKSICSFSKIIAEIDLMVTRMIFESYGVTEYLESHLQSMGYLLRIMKYRVPDATETNLGLSPHTDKNFTTVLHQNQVNGLEIESQNGEWINLDLSPSSFAVFAGDAIMAWSNGRIVSPNHRVTMPRACKTRYSLGLFTFSNGTIQVPEELVDEQHPIKFKPFEHLEFLRAFQASGPKYECSLKSYCGV